MKKNRSRIILLLAITIVLFTLTIAKNKVGSWFTKPVEKPFSLIATESIKQIDIVNDQKTTSLCKKNNQWYLKENQIEFIADQEKANQILTDFTQIVKDELISKNKKRFVDFGIEKNLLTIKTADKNYSIYVGQLSGINRTYIRINNEDAIFSVSGFSDIFSSPTNDYRDLSINFLKDENLINELSINDLVLSKSKEGWFINDKEVKSDQLTFYLSDLKNLKATDMLAQAPILSSDPELIIKLKANQDEQLARFYPVDDKRENYYLMTSNSKFVFQIPATSISTLKKEEKDFVK